VDEEDELAKLYRQMDIIDSFNAFHLDFESFSKYTGREISDCKNDFQE